jgi:hypothetical protein
VEEVLFALQASRLHRSQQHALPLIYSTPTHYLLYPYSTLSYPCLLLNSSLMRHSDSTPPV